MKADDFTSGWGRTHHHGFCVGFAASSTGERHYFHSLTSGGVKREGEPPVAYANASDAWEAYHQEFKKTLRTFEGDIYWREVPALKQTDGGCYVYSRLLVSQLPLQLPDSGGRAELSPSPPTQPPPEYLQYGWRAQKGPQASNVSGFRAVGTRVLLSIDEVEKKSAGGILYVEKTVTAEEQIAVVATVLEIGHDAWRDKTTDYCEVGDRVLIGQYVGKFHTSPVDGKKYRFVQDLDIISPLPKAT